MSSLWKAVCVSVSLRRFRFCDSDERCASQNSFCDALPWEIGGVVHSISQAGLALCLRADSSSAAEFFVVCVSGGGCPLEMRGHFFAFLFAFPLRVGFALLDAEDFFRALVPKNKPQCHVLEIALRIWMHSCVQRRFLCRKQRDGANDSAEIGRLVQLLTAVVSGLCQL